MSSKDSQLSEPQKDFNLQINLLIRLANTILATMTSHKNWPGTARIKTDQNIQAIILLCLYLPLDFYILL